MNQTTEDKGVIFEFGKFVLDPRERVLLADGTAVHLPDKVFDTLLLLIRHNGSLLTKDEMMTTLWDESFVEESNLAKNISRLRKILNADGSQLIETLPKRGYRFRADVREIGGDTNLLVRRNLRVRIKHETEIGEIAAPRQKRRTAFYLLPGLAAVALAVAAGFYFSRQTEIPKIGSIAVLPLRSITAGEDNRELGLGLTDALITRLGSLKTITVRPTSAIAKFAEAETDVLEIGRLLNVDAVFEGTIQKSENRLRINASLIKVATGEQLWTEKFDESETNIFALQDALSNKIAKTLFFELSNTEKRELVRRQTDSVEAYDKYLRGRFYQNQNSVQGLDKAIEFYEQAIALDNQFADAHAAYADALLILYNFGIRPPDEIVPKAKQSLNRALQLDPNLSDAYSALALIQFLSDRDWPAAEKSLNRAIELNPNNADAYLRYGYFLTAEGNFDDALIKMDKALLLNPLSPIVKTDIGLANLCARRYGTAIAQLEKVVADNPDVSLPRWFLGSGYDANAEPEKAFDSYVRALEREGGADLAARLDGIKKSEGEQAAYKVWLEENLNLRARGYFPALNIAFLYAAIRDREQTLAWLEKAFEEHDPTFWQIRHLPTYDLVRADPRFRELLRKS